MFIAVFTAETTLVYINKEYISIKTNIVPNLVLHILKMLNRDIC